MPNLPEGSDLFRSVLKQIDFRCETCISESGPELIETMHVQEMSRIPRASSAIVRLNSCTECGSDVLGDSKDSFMSGLNITSDNNKRLRWGDETANSSLEYIKLINKSDNYVRKTRTRDSRVPKSILKQR